MGNILKIHQMKSAMLIASLVACCGVAHAVVTPFTDDYGTGGGQVDVLDPVSGYTVSDSESTVGDPMWATQADSLQLARTNESYSSGYAAVATDLSAAAMTDFTMTSTVMMGTNGTAAFNRFGFLFLGDSVTSNGLTAVFYPNQGDFGQIRIRDYAFGNAGVDIVSRTSGAVTNGSDYTLTLYGSFNGAGDLSLAFSVVNADGGGSEDLVLGTIPAANLPSGNEFGPAGRVEAFAVDYDSLSVLPSTLLAVDDEYILPLVSSTNMVAPGVLGNDLGADSAVLIDDISSGSLSLDPDGSFSCSGLVDGSNTFTYAAVSGVETSAPVTVLLIAVLSEDPPTVADDAYLMDFGQGDSNIVGNVLDNDINNSLAFDLSAMEDDYTVSNGTLNMSDNGDFTYTPNGGFTGIETFTYKAYTPLATSVVATVTLTVEDNDPIREATRFDFNADTEFDNKGLGVTMTRTNNLDETMTITTFDIIGGDGTHATNGVNNKTNIQSVNALGINSANLNNDDYGSESRDFNPGEAWVISFDVDVALDFVDLASQASSTEMTVSSPAFADIVLAGSGDGNGGFDLGMVLVPAGTNIMFQMTSATNAADINLRIADLYAFNTNIVETTPYEDWVADQGLTNGINAYSDDPDGDDMDNLLEYALGADALSSDAPGFLPGYAIAEDGSTNYLNYVYRRRIDYADRGLTYEVGAGGNLVYEPLTKATEYVDAGAIDAEFESVTNRISMDVETQQFMQLKVTID